MKSIKDQLKNQESQTKKSDEASVDEIDAFLMQETVSSTIHYLWGYYKCYSRINKNDTVTAEDFFSYIDTLPHHDDDEKKKKYLLKNKNNINNFLYWYFYEG